jgi:hypothetical protein
VLRPEKIDMLGWIQCQWLGYRHDPVRQLVGGFRCARCGAVGRDLAELGFTGSAQIELVRKVYCRERGDVTRTSAWDTGEYRAVRRPTV